MTLGVLVLVENRTARIPLLFVLVLLQLVDQPFVRMLVDDELVLVVSP
jgi:hypothetical protein